MASGILDKGDFRTAFRLSLPVMSAYVFLGMTYGLLACGKGLPLWMPAVMAMVVYSGSVEFLALSMLLSAFDPLGAAVMALTVGARHVFYGITMLEPWRGAGLKKPFLIFWMSDETFAVNYANGGSFVRQLWVSFLDWVYWLSGCLSGYALGHFFGGEIGGWLQGLDFVVTAMFVAIFMDDFMSRGKHRSAWIGIGASLVCLWMFGAGKFVLPSMVCILAALYVLYRKEGGR